MCQSEDTTILHMHAPFLFYLMAACFQINIAPSTIKSRHAPKLILILSYGMMFSRLICIQLETLCIKLGRGACKIYEHSITHL